jgi:ribosomal-protein-alanine N-acetyltransferase
VTVATGVRLERLRWWHIEAVLPIDAELFGGTRWSAAMFWNELAAGNHYLVAVDGGEIVGYGGLALAPGEAWINTIGVRRDRQRAGIGRALLDALLARAAAAGADAVLLEVAADNAAAQRLYDSYGFEVVGVRRGYYQPANTDALVMRRSRR